MDQLQSGETVEGVEEKSSTPTISAIVREMMERYDCTALSPTLFYLSYVQEQLGDTELAEMLTLLDIDNLIEEGTILSFEVVDRARRREAKQGCATVKGAEQTVPASGVETIEL